MGDEGWFERNTYHHSAFKDVASLVRLKEERGLSISLCFPTLNEEATIGKEIVVARSELLLRNRLVDEIAVVDSGSSDRTLEVASGYGADTYRAEEVLPGMPPCRGKGENLWKALHALSGDIIVYIDADIKNIHPRFIYGLLGPLLQREEVLYVKAFYERPIALDPRNVLPAGGGRVTELVVRPLFSLFFPELAAVMQPLSGEYAGQRSLLESLAFPIGYGVETAMLIDIYKRFGMEAIAQVDLDKRVHRNQSTVALGKMSFGIIKTFFRKLHEYGLSDVEIDEARQMVQYCLEEGRYERKSYPIEIFERPPIASLPEYRERHPAAEAAGKARKGAG